MGRKSQQSYWSDVEMALDSAKGIAFDGCHKIYVLLDDAQVTKMESYDYGKDGSYLIKVGDTNRTEMLKTVKDWFEKSCSLKFVEAVETNEEDPNEGFESLIPQGAFDPSDYFDDDDDY